MIKNILTRMKDVISHSNPAPSLVKSDALPFKTHLLNMIEHDLRRLDKKDPTFLEDAEGHIDYYSPYAEAQMKSKEELLKRYINHFIKIQALYIHIQKKKAQLKTQSDQLKDETKNNIKDLLANESFNNISKNKEIQLEIARIKKIEALRQKPADQITDIDKQQITDFDKEMEALFDDKNHTINQFKALSQQTTTLQTSLSKHLKLKEKIPKGMLDVKRALYYQSTLIFLRNEIKTKTLALSKVKEGSKKRSQLEKQIAQLEEKKNKFSSIKFSESEQIDTTIKNMLADLRKLMAGSIQDYQELITSGGDINVFLHKTTSFYWGNLYLYRKAVNEINEYMQYQDTSELTEEGQLVAECIKSAFKEIPSQTAIEDALATINDVDKGKKARGVAYKEDVAISSKETQMIGFYKGESCVMINKLMQQDESAPLFYFPYNSRSYTLDHPCSDLADTLGNCYGETQMFLQRINQENPAINNICPQSDLINDQLDQTRSAGPLNITLDTLTTGLMKSSVDPRGLSQEELKIKLDGKPAYVLFDSEIYYIDGAFNITNLSRQKQLSTQDCKKITDLFPEKEDVKKAANRTALQTIKETMKIESPNKKVTWDSLKGTLTKKSDSKKNGDLCWIKFSDAKTSGGTPFAHVVGFIKIKNPNPYKYIVYDYSLGAIGVSNDEQLDLLFKQILNQYPAFGQFEVKKVAEVSSECTKFLTDIQTLKKSNDPCIKTPIVNYWDKNRLLQLIKCSDFDSPQEIKLISEAINNLAREDQETVCRKWFEKASLNTLLKPENAALASILNMAFQSQKITTLAPSEKMLEKVFMLVKNERISANVAISVFNQDKSIYTKLVKFTDKETILILMGKPTKKGEHPSYSELAVQAFPTDKDIFLKAYRYSPANKKENLLKLGDQGMIAELMRNEENGVIFTEKYRKIYAKENSTTAMRDTLKTIRDGSINHPEEPSSKHVRRG